MTKAKIEIHIRRAIVIEAITYVSFLATKKDEDFRVDSLTDEVPAKTFEEKH